jgi:hypothetical protein
MAARTRLITDCKLDRTRLAPIRDCMKNYGVEDEANSEWPWNTIARNAVAYRCGALARRGDRLIHSHDPKEFALCERLAAKAAAKMDGEEVGMGSAGVSYFRPYFRVANVGERALKTITVPSIKRAFGGTIHPEIRVYIERLGPSGRWAQSIREYWIFNEDVMEAEGKEYEKLYAEGFQHLKRWAAMMNWFAGRCEFRDIAFVSIGRWEDLNGSGCVFPRLAVGLTHAGSFAGIAGWVVK